MEIANCSVCNADLSDTYDGKQYVMARFAIIDGKQTLQDVRCPHHSTAFDEHNSIMTSYFRGV